MALLRQVDALADDVVAAVVDVDNPSSLLSPLSTLLFPLSSLLSLDSHAVADSHGVGAPYAFDTEVALNLTVKQLAIVHADGVPAACILDD